MENLRYMLKDYKFSDLLYFGCKFGRFVENGFMSGGAGKVINNQISLLFYCIIFIYNTYMFNLFNVYFINDFYSF